PPNHPWAIWFQQHYNLNADGKVTFKKDEVPKICDLCGGPIGRFYHIGLTHLKPAVGANTCDQYKCTQWLVADITAEKMDE
ncbi:hypothetical protein GWN26_11700, partial [Candidatus Saccharibacteria bacterium]|nr:hypothetical protein [Candidatus Saccharibacteria bacterium]NIV04165.1 hypothetical protein [Calditrichia bacterium]NIS38710.1 hypothetical protein [Candidatus Saccharibacteria bacterium]NIV72614.1 hypothetical protein [Calditrichia bacterium]NIV99744.1 hypothetical protein [Candidatus Saccharibacteria bacterium]